MILTVINNRPAIVKEDGTVIFHSIYVGMRYQGTMYNVLKDYTDQHWSVEECESFQTPKDLTVLGNDVKCFKAVCENAVLWAAANDKHVLLRTEIHNLGEEKEEETVIALGGMYVNRLDRAMWNGYTPYGKMKHLDMGAETKVMRFCENDYCISAVNMPMIDETGQSFHCGFVSFEQYFASVFACEGGTIEFRHTLDGRKLAAGDIMYSDWMLFSLYDDIVEELPEYARFIHDFNRFEDHHTTPPVGFSTWYYYMGNINERTVYENLAKCDEIRDRVPFEVFQIDAGWAPGNHNGDYHHDRFPKGMKYYADLIKEHGMIPGIWIKPFDFEPDNEVVKEHPEWFIKNGEGAYATVKGKYLLDVTHPGAKQYVRDVYHRITYDWGYRYLKIDIVSDFMSEGVYTDPEAGALQNVREYFRLVREAAHPDTYILGCTCPIYELAEFVDGIRTSLDIFERWESLLSMFNRLLKRYYMNGTLFVSDPDCLIIRKAENEDEDCRRYCSRNDDEIHTFLVAMYATGGAFLVSDKLPLLNDKQIEMYAKMLPLGNRVGKPLDLMESYIPGIIDMGAEEDVRRVALINWGERERSFSVKLDGTYCVTEHFTEEELGVHTGAYQVTLAPHCSQLAVFTREK